jgi:hypothetical protein
MLDQQMPRFFFLGRFTFFPRFVYVCWETLLSEVATPFPVTFLKNVEKSAIIKNQLKSTKQKKLLLLQPISLHQLQQPTAKTIFTKKTG